MRQTAKDVPVIVYEPLLDSPEFYGSEVTQDLEELKSSFALILVNRWDKDLFDVSDKVFARDLSIVLEVIS